MRTWGSCVWAVLVAAAVGLSALADGVDAGSFVRDGASARAFGMGGAYAAIAAGAVGGYWNPAGLSVCELPTVGGLYMDKYGLDISFQSLGVGVPITEEIGVGVVLIRSSIDDIPFSGAEGDGVFSETQSVYVLSGACDLGTIANERPDGSAVSASFHLGGSVKSYSHRLLEGRSSGIGFDVGLLASVALGWGTVEFGLCAADLFDTSIQWYGTDHNPMNEIPWVNRCGIALSLLEQRLVVAAEADIALQRSHLNRLRGGVEFSVVEGLTLRGGIVMASDGETRFSTGGTLGWRNVLIDYAFVPHRILGNSHIFSFEVQLSAPWLEPDED